MSQTADDGAQRTPRFEEVASALAATRVGVWSWDKATDTVRWSPEISAIFGLPPGAVARTFEEYLALFPDDEAARLRFAIKAAMKRAEERPEDKDARTYFNEHCFRRRDGAVVWTEARGHVELDERGRCSGMAGIAIDATARKLAEAALRKQAEEYRLFTELASDYVYSGEVQPDGKLQPSILAGSFERTTGHSFESVQRAGDWSAIVHPEDRPAMLALVPRIMAGETIISEYRILDPEGGVRWLRDRVRPVRNARTGQVERIVGGVTDITQRKRLEAELLQARKLEAIGRLAGAVAHDFNNLLTVILNAADMLVRTHGELAGDEDLRAIVDAARRGGELGRSLLTIGRRQVDVAQPIGVGDLLASAEPVIRRALGDRIALEVAAPDATLSVSVDRSQAHLLLLNLALNARDAMPTGGAFRLGAQRLRSGEGRLPSELPPGDYALITASDSGVGIGPDVLPHMFEPFFTTKADGTGLGLATCHGIVRAAGGAIVAESAPGEGATFRIFLPATEHRVQRAAPSILSERGGRETVLVVEDVTALRGLVARELRGRGYTVVVAGSAEEALTLLDAPGRPTGHDPGSAVDLALLDIGLPGMSGAELATRLQRDHTATRIVLMSGNPGEEATHALVAAGVPFLQKPFGTTQMAELIRRVLDAAQR